MLESSLQPFIAVELASLEKHLAAIEAQNAVLADTVAYQNREADALVKSLELAVRDLERAGTLAHEDGNHAVGNLIKETKAIEETLRQSIWSGTGYLFLNRATCLGHSVL